MICVFGATGQVGLPLVQRLSQGGHKVRALAHSENGATRLRLPGVEAVVGDFREEKAIARALQGTRQLFLLTPATPDQVEVQNRIVDAAVKAGVEGIVKLSVYTAEENSLCHFSRLHWVNDRYIEQCGIPYTILHPHTFMQTLALLFGYDIRAANRMSAAVGPDKTITMVDLHDVADVAAAVLARGEHRAETLLITGPEALSYSDCARLISERLGRQIQYVQISEREAITQLLRAGVPDWLMEGIKDLYRIYDGGNINPFSKVTQEWTGHEPRSFRKLLEDNPGLFS